MFDGLREDWQEQPRPAFVRRGSVCLPLILGALIFAALMLFMAMARAQNPPSGTPVLNQAGSARALTASDTTVFQATRGIDIGDAAACNVVVRFAQDPSSQLITLSNRQPGAVYPYSIIQLRAATTCASVTALY